MTRCLAPRARRAVATAGLLLAALPGRLPAQITSDPDRRATERYHLAQEARRQGDDAAAERMLAEVVLLDPDAVEPRLAWAEALFAVGRPDAVDGALAPISEAVEAAAGTRPGDAARHDRLRAAARLRAGDLDAAVPLYERAVLRDPYDAGLRAQLIGLHRQRGAMDIALVHMRALADLVPQSVELRVQVGEAALAANRWGEAETAFREALVLRPTGETWDGLGLALGGQSRWDEAEAAFREGLRLAPGSRALYEHLGDLLLAAGRASEALTAFERAAVLSDGAPGLAEKIERARAAMGGR